MTDLVAGTLGPETKYDLDLVAGKLVATANFAGAQMSAGLNVSLDVIALLEILKAKIPGSVDDTIIGIVEAFLKAQGA